MSDIVQWLRESPSNEWCSPMLEKAATEIERLRAEVEHWRHVVDLLGNTPVVVENYGEFGGGGNAIRSKVEE